MRGLRNKKGVGNVVAMASMILVGILAVATIWVYLSLFFSNVNFAPQVSCLEMQAQPSNFFEIKSACQTPDGKIRVLLTRGFDDAEINNFKFAVDAGNEIRTFACGDAEICGDCILQDAGTKNYYLDYSGNAEKVSVVVNGCVLGERQVQRCD